MNKRILVIVGDFEPCNKGGDRRAGPPDKLGRLHRIALTDRMNGLEMKAP